MPGGDRTGPNGLGPMAGRAAGYGAQRPTPAYMNLVLRCGFWSGGRGRGKGRGKGQSGGQGMGKGRGLGGGKGRGRRMMSSSGAATPLQIGDEEVSASTTPSPPFRSGNDQELEALKAQASATEQEPTTINEKGSQMLAGGRRRSSFVATVDTVRCTGCGSCAAVCPMGAITIDAAASIETSSCTGVACASTDAPRERSR